MSEVTLSIMELGFLKETLETALEEFNGIEEAQGCLDDYVITTGAIRDCESALALIDTLVDRLEPELWEEEEEEEDHGDNVFDMDEEFTSMFTDEELEEFN